MTYEYPIHDGFVVQHYGADDWFPVVDAGWWVREWLMCDEGCHAEVRKAEDAYDAARRAFNEISYVVGE